MIRTIQVSGLKEAQRNFRRLAPRLQYDLRVSATRAAAQEVAKETRRGARAVSRTDNLARNVRVGQLRRKPTAPQRRLHAIIRSGPVVFAVWFTLNAFYALFLEAGTRARYTRAGRRYRGQLSRRDAFFGKAFRRALPKAIAAFRRKFVEDWQREVRRLQGTRARRAGRSRAQRRAA